MKKIAFVMPWYGEKINGGAENLLKGLVHHLQDSGVELEVLSTCVESFRSDWNSNFYKAGLTIEAGIEVRRFKVRKRNTAIFDSVNIKLMHGERITSAEEDIFCREMINSPDLYRYIRENGDQYSFFVFIPYMFGTSYYGCQIWPEKSILIPCLHDESYAYMDCFRKAFSQVKGMIFNSDPERLLAERLYGVKGKNFVTFGLGLDVNWESYPERFRDKYKINDPFILYAGRKDEGKRVDILIRNFLLFKKRHPSDLKLVMIGGGNISIPDRDNIMDLGFVDVQDKYDAYGAASIFCNPSDMESFSIVIMESWLAGRPVLVNGNCAVTKDFVLRAQGGLYYDSANEFDCAVNWLLTHRAISDQMGKNGRNFVLENFSWEMNVKNYRNYFERIRK